MKKELYSIMSDLGVIIDELEEMNKTLQLQSKAVSEELSDIQTRSVLNVQIRLLERIIGESHALYNKIDCTVLNLKSGRRKNKTRKTVLHEPCR